MLVAIFLFWTGCFLLNGKTAGFAQSFNIGFTRFSLRRRAFLCHLRLIFAVLNRMRMRGLRLQAKGLTACNIMVRWEPESPSWYDCVKRRSGKDGEVEL